MRTPPDCELCRCADAPFSQGKLGTVSVIVEGSGNPAKSFACGAVFRSTSSVLTYGESPPVTEVCMLSHS